MIAERTEFVFPLGRCCQRCRHTKGHYVQRGGQLVCYCTNCGKYAGFSVTREFTGLPSRIVASISSATSRVVYARDQHRCLLTGKSAPAVLHLSHVVSVRDGLAAGYDTDALHQPRNLFVEHEAGNLGRGSGTVDHALLHLLISRMRLSVSDADALIAMWKAVQFNPLSEAAE